MNKRLRLTFWKAVRRSGGGGCEAHRNQFIFVFIARSMEHAREEKQPLALTRLIKIFAQRLPLCCFLFSGYSLAIDWRKELNMKIDGREPGQQRRESEL